MNNSNIGNETNHVNNETTENASPAVPAKLVRKSRTNRKIISAVILCFCFVAIISTFSDNVTRSTHERRPLALGKIDDAGYYTDEFGFLDSKWKLEYGLKDFYKETGVQPYIYITNSVNGTQPPTQQQLDEYANNTYKKLFTDEGHLLMVLYYNGSGYMDSYVCGTQAAYFIDGEAKAILKDYIAKYYSEHSKSSSEFLSEAFKKAADRMTTVSNSPWAVFIIFTLIAAVVVALYIRSCKKEAHIIEDRETEEMLKIPLEKFGDPEVEELAKKYENPPEK